jgi:hypothetical protein
MRLEFFRNLLFVLLLVACNNNSVKENIKSDTANMATSIEKKPVSIDEIVTAYLELKNALVNDNGKDAAEAGGKINAALAKIDEASFTEPQKKVYDDVKEDIQENAEHINNNAGKIEHQREHFDWLSSAVYGLVKVVKPTGRLYKDRCLMFNNNKGAIWLSETKEIKNPYYGKKMLTCGVIKEEIK